MEQQQYADLNQVLLETKRLLRQDKDIARVINGSLIANFGTRTLVSVIGRRVQN